MGNFFLKKQTAAEEGRIYQLPVGEIASNPCQPRQIFEPKALEELAESIRANGLLQPVTVRKSSQGGYELIAGERRLMAAKLLEWETIPAIVRDADDNASGVLALLENIQRENLNYFEEAAAMQKLMELLGENQQQLAVRLGKSQPAVANKLRLLRIPPRAAEKMVEWGLTERHARALLKLCKRPDFESLAKQVAQKKWNVAQTEEFVERILADKPKRKRTLVVRDVRIFLNSIDQAIRVMKEAGVSAVSRKEETEEAVVYTITIPKAKAASQAAGSLS